MTRFNKAVRKTILHEGGATYTNDPDDPGGETKFGISKRSFPHVNIRELTQATAIEIYRKNYWAPIQADQIKSNVVAETIFDTAVNMGVRTTIKLVQTTLDIKVDGIIGKQTLGAVNKVDGDLFLAQFVITKIARYATLCNRNRRLKKYLLGWINRTLETAA